MYKINKQQGYIVHHRETELLFCNNFVSMLSHVWFFVTPQELQPTRQLGPWNFTGKNIGVGCHFLLQGIFLT